jgi:cyclophilin family peptidyl-prolyl cis-trans isomerase
MGKRKRQSAGTRFTHAEIASDSSREPKHHPTDPTAFDFDMCCLTYLPIRTPVICRFGYSFSRDAAEQYAASHDRHPFEDSPFLLTELTAPRFTLNGSGDRLDPVTEKVLSPMNRIVMILTTGHCYDSETVQEFNLKADMMIDLLTGQPFTRADIVAIHDPTRSRQLPPIPMISSEISQTTSAVVRKSREFVKSFTVESRALDSDDGMWFLARPTQASLAAATAFKQCPPALRPHAIVATSLGEFVVELDVPDVPVGCLNFIGHVLRKSYTAVHIERVERHRSFEISVATAADETVWATPIAYERNTARRCFKYPVFFVNTGNRQIHVTNTGRFIVGCAPVDIGEHHVFGGVVTGEGVVAAICGVSVFPDGRPMRAVTIETIAIGDNPFPLAPV